jgi:hypothetical protein
MNPWLIGGLTLGGISVGKDIMNMVLKSGLDKKNLSLEEKMMSGQLEGMKMGNEANRLAAQEYMTMLSEEKAGQRKDKNMDRRMQLMMMMISGINQFNQQSAEAKRQQALPPPPTGMMTLLRGQ